MAIDERHGSSLHGAAASLHSFVKAPPGSGPLPVCEHCGSRDTAINRQKGCDGRPQHGEQIQPSDYDPYIGS